MSAVYFIQSGAGGPIKIGTAKNLRKRVSELQCGCPDLLVVLASVEGGRQEESYLHQRLRPDRHRGEWFKPTPVVLAAVEEARSGRLDVRPLKQQHKFLLVGAGIVRVAETVGVPVNTVRAWVQRDSIPGAYWKAIVDAGFSTYDELTEGVHARARPIRESAAA